jgi:integrase
LLVTGARRSEVLRATWDQFDLEDGSWTKPSSHTKQKRIHRVPLNRMAIAILHEMARLAERCARDRKQQSEPAYVFPGNVEGQPLTELKRFWSTTIMRASLRNVRLHDLRHSYASVLASEGQSLPVIGALLGHTQQQTTMRYAHLLDAPLRAATDTFGQAVDRAMKQLPAPTGRSRRRPK